MALPLDRFLNAIWWWSIQRVEPDKLEQWKAQIEAPMPERRVTRAAVERDLDQFASFAGAFGVSPPQPG